MFHTTNHSGFTLVELAIVIVIIGLLVGGVLQGQELIQQSRINTAVSKINSYNSAVNIFKAKYNSLPGDILNPGFFGLNNAKGNTALNTCYTCFGGAVTSSSGGGGDGNSILGVCAFADCRSTSGGFIHYSLHGGNHWGGELANFFPHLSNAQLVKEGFSQVVENRNLDTAFPRMPVGTGMVILQDRGTPYWVLGTSTDMFYIGGALGSSLSPSEALTIDTKLDDGKPLSGSIQAVSGYASATFTLSSTGATNCIFTDSNYNAIGSYENEKLCTLRILGNF